MTGQLLWRREREQENRHDHFMIAFEQSEEVLWYRDIRRFGHIFFCRDNDPLPSFLTFGPDPFEISAGEFVALFEKRSGNIKNLLLNQKILSGLGNIYVNESLYRAGIRPTKPPCRVSRKSMEKLHAAIVEVLSEAIRCGGSSIDDYRHPDGTPGSFQKHHRVYAREGEPCFSCGAVIRKMELAARSSFFCGQCQK